MVSVFYSLQPILSNIHSKYQLQVFSNYTTSLLPILLHTLSQPSHNDDTLR